MKWMAISRLLVSHGRRLFWGGRVQERKQICTFNSWYVCTVCGRVFVGQDLPHDLLAPSLKEITDAENMHASVWEGNGIGVAISRGLFAQQRSAQPGTGARSP